MSKFFKTRKTRAWFITTCSVLAVGVTANVLCSPDLHILYDVANTVFGGQRPITAGGENAAAAYEKTTNSKEEAKAAGDAVNREICQEGIVLLKNTNKALPLKANAKVSVFGKNSVNLVYGSSGSGGGDSTEAVKLGKALADEGIVVNPALTAFYNDNGKSGGGRTSNPAIENSGNIVLETGETPIDKYTADLEGTYNQYADAAIIVLSRIAGEGFDLPMTSSDDINRHYLQLDSNEKALIDYVTSKGFAHVLVYVNSNNPLECGFLENEKIDAAIWSGGLGNSGVSSLAEIISGKVNPSGHLVDTFARDFKADPVWQNFGNNRISGKVSGDQYTEEGTGISNYFVDYEEGIYVGYRYWETRGKSEGEDWYKDHVVYPFGYGLSYSSFSWEVMNEAEISSQALTADGKYEIKVKVKNTSEVAGKDVVQVYVNLPYTNGGIEKASSVLAGFAKTKLLEAGQEETLSIEVDPYYFASYDYQDKDADGFKGYEIEKGSYSFSVSSDAHHSFKDINLPALAETIRYENDPVTGTKVENRFEDSDRHLQQQLSRADWNGTFPVSPTDNDRDVYWWMDNKDMDIEEELADKSSTNPLKVDTMPITGTITHPVSYEDPEDHTQKERGLVLRDLVGKDFDDPLWDDLLNQASVDEMKKMYDSAAFKTLQIDSIGKPLTYETDGPSGYVNFMNTSIFYGCCKYANEPVVAATYNVDLVYKLGQAVGEEGLQGNGVLPYSGWYAPGLNIHRGQFGGRVAEYYSEDPFLSGRIGASLIKGCRSKGVYPMMKHFALNEQETHRAVGGSNSWCNEQAIREIYLRPFEMAVKEGKVTAVMTSFNRIGTRWTGGDYRLLTEVLRNEWGFHGGVICDFNTNPSYMISKQMAYAGGNLNLATQPVSWVNASNPTDVQVLKNCTKEVLYMVANSCVLNVEIIGYKMAIWVELLIAIDVLLVVGLGVWGFFAIYTTYRPKKALKPEGEGEAEAKEEK